MSSFNGSNVVHMCHPYMRYTAAHSFSTERRLVNVEGVATSTRADYITCLHPKDGPLFAYRHRLVYCSLYIRAYIHTR